MPALVTALFGLVVIGYVAGSPWLHRWNITAPIVFTLLGALAGWLAASHVEAGLVHDLAELTLALILFHDAAQVRPRQIERDAGLTVRLLFVGLPLTVLLGYLTAWLLLPGIGTWLALMLAATLAPTDAGLGAATVLNPVVPVRIRRVHNVESGLNDGLATPVVLFAIASAGGVGTGSPVTLGAALGEIVAGALVGILLGAGSGRLLAYARREWHVEPGLLWIGTAAVPLAAYYGSHAVHGNGFVAAFIAGTAFASGFAAVAKPVRTDGVEPADPLQLTEWVSTALSYAVWALFGAVAVAHLGSMLTWRGAVYAVLSLTLLRMLPVAVALVGSRLRRPTVLFVGWFGPRGLASVVFGLIAVESLPATSELQAVLGTITVTVVLSVVLHGVTADPGAERYGRWVERVRPTEETTASVEPARGRAR